MCGIAGLVGSFSKAESLKKIKIMTDAVAHRGPDAEGIFVRDNIALGHRRLSIIDLNENSNQPMSDCSDRYTIVFNGEIYNYREVKAKLYDYDFKTNSDTEVLLAAFIQNGVACLNEINGMFAFAIWDAAEETLFVARDRVGKKPFYYFHDGATFVFASEMRALLASGLVERKLDDAALNEYLQFYSVGAPHTLIKNIKVLPPGSCGMFRNNEFTQHKYWSYTTNLSNCEDGDYTVVARRVKELLQAAVERRLISDVTLGAFLSGGIDSSAIVALMATISAQPIKTFSIGFAEKEYDESIYSTLIAQKYNTEHTHVELTAQDFMLSLPTALAAMDFPTIDGVNTFVVSQATKKAGCTVALSGLGGDELFAGYPIFTQYQQIKRLRHYYCLPRSIKSIVGRVAAAAKRDHKAERREQLLALENTEFENLYPVFRRSFSSVESLKLMRGFSFNDASFAHVYSSDELARINQMPDLSQVSVGELSSYTLNLLLRDADQMSMAHALEIRVPFLDYKLIEYVLGLPDKFKQPTYPKKLLVDSLGNLLPSQIVHRKKMGFTFPWSEWLRGELKEFCLSKFADLRQRQLFDVDALNQIMNGFFNYSPRVPWVKFWLLVILADWIERNKINV